MRASLLCALFVSCALVCAASAISFDQVEDASLKSTLEGMFAPDASYCRMGGYDFSYLRSSTDYLGYDTSRSFNYYMNVCGAVNYSPCAKYNSSSSICSESNNDSPTYVNLGSFVTSPPAWSWASNADPSYGVTAQLTNGDRCGNGYTTTTTVNFICSDSTAPTFNVLEATCSYTFTFRIQCPVVPPRAVNCNYGGYDFSGLTAASDYVTYGTSTNSNFYLNICAPVSHASCVAHANSSVCQTDHSGNSASSLGLYVANTGQWSFMDMSNPGKGVRLTYANSNDRCNINGYSYTTSSIVNLYCSPSTQPSSLAVLYGPGTCQWTFSLNVYCRTIQQSLAEYEQEKLAATAAGADSDAAAASPNVVIN